MKDEIIIHYDTIYNPVENTKNDMKISLLSENDNNKYCFHSFYIYFIKKCFIKK